MTVGIKVGSITDEIGSPDFFNAFFCTIAARLEPAWGARFPVLMTRLYDGHLDQSDAVAALAELAAVRAELSTYAPEQVVWDIEDGSKAPPWGSNVATTITDLSNYFVTSTGRDLISTLQDAFEEVRDRGGSAEVVSY